MTEMLKRVAELGNANSSCGSACGSSDPKKANASCGSACGAADPDKK